MRSYFVCTLLCLCSAGSLYAEQATIAELSKSLPEEKVQTINGRWIIKVRVPVQGTASTARKLAQSAAESIGKGKILEHACTPQRDGRPGKLNGVITELATNRINIDGDTLEAIMSAPIQKPRCTFESSDSKKNTNEKINELLSEESPRAAAPHDLPAPVQSKPATSAPASSPPLSAPVSASISAAPLTAPEISRSSDSTAASTPVSTVRDTGSDY